MFVTKTYNCPLCAKKHKIEFPKNFADNRAAYPFVHTYLHSFEPNKPSPDRGKDVITILYIDKNLEIRHVEAMLQNAEGNIVSMEDAQKMISLLTAQLDDMQDSYDALSERYSELLKAYETLKSAQS